MSARSRILVVFFLIITIAISAASYWFRGTPSGDIGKNEVSAENPESAAVVPRESVELSPEKLKAANLSFTEARVISLRVEAGVPGRLLYDDRRHVEIRSATAGIITDIRVKPGDHVRAGDLLVVLNSSDVGNARADVLQRTAALTLATEKRDWQKATCNGLMRLSEAIRSRVPVEEIREQFKDVTLGKSREQLLTAYSDLLLAESLADSAQENAQSGILPGRVLRERRASRENTEATLTAALEELTFEATQARRQAEADVNDVERRLRISIQSVRTLLGNTTTEDLTELDDATAETETRPENQDGDVLSLVRLRAPFDGTIERRLFGHSERVDGGSAVLTLADTSTLWVAADLREREWTALDLKQGDEIRVTSPIDGNESLIATVHFLGREVDPQTNAVPLVAVVDNADGRLRPGMPVRVSVPVSAPRDVLAVPESSVLRHRGRTFVFTSTGPSAFRRTDIQPGQQTAGMVEVVSGVDEGAQVVSGGAFYLKSELLLQSEEN